MERYLLNEKWHFVSPPISDGVSNIYYDIYLRSYIEPTSTWFFIVPVDIPMNTMQGYEAWASDFYTGTTTVTYTGTLNTGALSISNLTYTPTAPISRGYNLVGNPYPSAVDWNISIGWVRTNLDDALYIWNPYAGNYRSYIDGVGNNGGTNIIPSGQGFFVHVNSNYSNGALGINNNARLHDNTLFLKSTEESSDNPLLRIKTSSSATEYWDETVIQFTEFSSPAFDPQVDAFKIMGLLEAPQLYTFSNGQDELSINSLPPLINNTRIPLFLKVGIDGIYTVEATESLNFQENTIIMLEDKKMELLINFQEQSSHSFSANVLDESERFVLHFLVNEYGTNDIEEVEKIQIFSSGDHIYLTAQGEKPISGTISVVDILGKILLTEPISNVQQHVLFVPQNGIFIVNFYDSSSGIVYRKKIQLY